MITISSATPAARDLRWRIKASLAALSAVAALGIAPATAAARTPQVRVCATQTAAVLGWDVYEVCLSATDSWNGRAARGYVSGVYCNVDPTGTVEGFACDGYTKGSYWDASRGYWEDWLNFRVARVSPTPPYGEAFENCVYQRVDTRPNGVTTYQNFTVSDQPLGKKC